MLHDLSGCWIPWGGSTTTRLGCPGCPGCLGRAVMLGPRKRPCNAVMINLKSSKYALNTHTHTHIQSHTFGTLGIQRMWGCLSWPLSSPFDKLSCTRVCICHEKLGFPPLGVLSCIMLHHRFILFRIVSAQASQHLLWSGNLLGSNQLVFANMKKLEEKIIQTHPSSWKWCLLKHEFWNPTWHRNQMKRPEVTHTKPSAPSVPHSHVWSPRKYNCDNPWRYNSYNKR